LGYAEAINAAAFPLRTIAAHEQDVLLNSCAILYCFLAVMLRSEVSLAFLIYFRQYLLLPGINI
jgi:hypothetical protein